MVGDRPPVPHCVPISTRSPQCPHLHYCPLAALVLLPNPSPISHAANDLHHNSPRQFSCPVVAKARSTWKRSLLSLWPLNAIVCGVARPIAAHRPSDRRAPCRLQGPSLAASIGLLCLCGWQQRTSGRPERPQRAVHQPHRQQHRSASQPIQAQPACGMWASRAVRQAI